MTGSAPPFAQSASSEPDQNDPCSLLEPKEVEAALGAPLAVPPYRSSGGPFGATPGLRGDQLITIDFTASPATLRQAAMLVDSAYKRIAKPLKIDGGASVEAAKGEADSKAAAGIPVPASGGDPAEAIDTGYIGGFTMVKRDVMVTVNGGFVDPEREKALLTAIVQKL